MPPAPQGAIDRIAAALHRLSEVTQAVQNTSVAVTHVANHHERLADAAHLAAGHVGTLAQGVGRMAGAAERFVALCERLEPVVEAVALRDMPLDVLERIAKRRR